MPWNGNICWSGSGNWSSAVYSFEFISGGDWVNFVSSPGREMS